jgi:Matrixin
MMRTKRKHLGAILSLLALLGAQSPARAYSLAYRDGAGVVARRWLSQPIIIAFSSSLVSPPANMKAGSDVLGAARRALSHWAGVANIQFFETSSTLQTTSAPNGGDRVNLISVSADNASLFGASEDPGRTRVFYDSGGAITEADIALNPNVTFSSDGTLGTYDLESTFTHEIGHLLGLEHSAILAATMQPRQAMNGLFGLPAFTQRTLSDDDIAGARALYGSRAGAGSISGRLVATSVGGQSRPVFGALVFAEEASTGRVVAGDVTLASGEYRIEALPAGSYHIIGQSLGGPIRAEEVAVARGNSTVILDTSPSFRTHLAMRSSSELIPVTADTTTSLGFFVSSRPAPLLKPRLIGINGELSTVAIPLKAGTTVRVYIAGEGIEEVSASGVSVSSPFMSIDPETLTNEEFDLNGALISFEIAVGAKTPAGDYSVVLKSSEGEMVYLVGVLTVEP